MEKQRKEIKELWKQEQNKMVSIVMEFHLALCERREASAASEQLSGKIVPEPYCFSKMLS